MDIVYAPISPTSALVRYRLGTLEESTDRPNSWLIRDRETGKILSLQDTGAWGWRDVAQSWESATRIGEADGKLIYSAANAAGVVLYSALS